MTPRDLCNYFDFVRRETQQLAILDQVVRMTIVAIMINRMANVVQQRRIFQKLARTGWQFQHRRRAIEERYRKPRDSLPMLVRAIETTSECLDRTPPHLF